MNDLEPFRYRLDRDLGLLTGEGRLAFVMLNPSTATEEKNDPTVRRCIGFAKRENASRLFVANLWAKRSTDPAGLYDVAGIAPTHAEIEAWVEALECEGPTVCAWGSGGGRAWLRTGIQLRAQLFVQLAKNLGVETWCLGTTNDGHPRHPLYVRSAANLIRWPR